MLLTKNWFSVCVIRESKDIFFVPRVPQKTGLHKFVKTASSKRPIARLRYERMKREDFATWKRLFSNETIYSLFDISINFSIAINTTEE